MTRTSWTHVLELPLVGGRLECNGCSSAHVVGTIRSVEDHDSHNVVFHIDTRNGAALHRVAVSRHAGRPAVSGHSYVVDLGDRVVTITPRRGA